jgi:hypothetical protein
MKERFFIGLDEELIEIRGLELERLQDFFQPFFCMYKGSPPCKVTFYTNALQGK